jgi:hypothetical protein
LNAWTSEASAISTQFPIESTSGSRSDASVSGASHFCCPSRCILLHLPLLGLQITSKLLAPSLVGLTQAIHLGLGCRAARSFSRLNGCTFSLERRDFLSQLFDLRPVVTPVAAGQECRHTSRADHPSMDHEVPPETTCSARSQSRYKFERSVSSHDPELNANPALRGTLP